jgi:hypothetical protein
MPKPKPRDLVKQVVRAYCSLDVQTWDDAAAKVGFDPVKLAWWRRRADWPALCREVAEEEMTVAYAIGACRLVESARLDRSSSGITAAKTLIDLCRGEPGREADGTADVIEFEDLTREEREVICRLFPKVRRSGAMGGAEA